MSQETEKQERGRLQHAAEHERPNKRNSVLFYLVILFAAAFVLLLMSFLMQQRANQAALDDLQQTSDSTVQSLENMLQENESLKEQNAELQAQVDALEEQVNSAQTDTGETDALQRQLDALTYLNQIRALYNEAMPTPGTWPPPPSPLWPGMAAWRACWGRSPPPSPTRSGRTTTPWMPTTPSPSG